jgi:dihydropteroate synthase
MPLPTTRSTVVPEAKRRPATKLYLRPLAVLSREAARQALAAGFGLPLGRAGAFLACELSCRGSGSLEQKVLPTAELRAWAAARGSAFEQALERQLARLANPAPMPRLSSCAANAATGPSIMGVINVTPDSFSDGGRFLDPGAAIAHGERLHDEGADILDVGGESTRPGAAPVPAEEEIRRVVPVVRALAGAGRPVSIDTRKAVVMRAALDAGAAMINDISALRHDPDSLAIAGASGAPVILMHSRGEPATMQHRPHYERVSLDIFDHFEQRIQLWESAGFARSRLLLDPGIGFGKTLDHNLEILQRLDLYRSLGLPLVLGVSRKSFVARICGDLQETERLPGSLAAALFGLAHGISLLRVHDVGATRQAVRLWQAITDASVDCLQRSV